MAQTDMIVSFRVMDDFRVKLGSDQVEVVIPRLLFKDADRVLAAVARIIGSSTEAALALAQSALDFTDGKQDEVGARVQQAVGDILASKSIGIVNELLGAMTYGAVTEGVLASMQYAEVVGLVKYLIDQNFETLKNLFASLQAVTTSQLPGTR